MRLLRVLAVVVVGFVGQVAAAQADITSTCPADAPVTLQPDKVPNGGAELDVVITNNGPKPITAVILSARITDSEGISLVQTGSVDYAPSGILFEPGKSTKGEIEIGLASGHTLKSAEVTCLAVLYQARGIWGDAKSPEVAHLRAVRQGISAERKRLHDVYAKEGTARLVEEVGRPIAK